MLTINEFSVNINILVDVPRSGGPRFGFNRGQTTMGSNSRYYGGQSTTRTTNAAETLRLIHAFLTFIIFKGCQLTPHLT